jgi:hypothetical protein
MSQEKEIWIEDKIISHLIHLYLWNSRHNIINIKIYLLYQEIQYDKKHSTSEDKIFIKWYFMIISISREYLMLFKQNLDYHHSINHRHLPNQVRSSFEFYFILFFFCSFHCRNHILLFCKETKWLWIYFISTKTNTKKSWLCKFFLLLCRCIIQF